MPVLGAEMELISISDRSASGPQGAAHEAGNQFQVLSPCAAGEAMPARAGATADSLDGSRADTGEETERGMCAACYEDRALLATACAPASVCYDCAQQLRECPIFRARQRCGKLGAYAVVHGVGIWA